MITASLKAGTTPAKGTIVVLMRDTGCGSFHSAPARVSWFEADGSWTVPETVNGYYYAQEVQP